MFMRRHCHVATAALALALFSCNPSGQDAGGDGEPAPEAAGDAGGNGGPIALTDERLDKYLAYQKEVRESYARWHKEMVGLAKTIDAKSTDISKGWTAVMGSARLGEKQEKEMRALREKHGFTEDEDSRLSSAISDVVAATPLENPFMGDALKSYRDMQAAGGEQGKVAAEALKSFEDQEKEGLARARKEYGDACVDVLSRRVKDLHKFQVEAVSALSGQAPDEAK
jgi:hypothetical protein